MASTARIWCAASRIALRPLAWCVPEWAERPSNLTSKRPTPLRAVTILPPSRAGSVTSTAAEARPICSISPRVVGEPISSSGVNRNTIGRFAVPASATSLKACKREPGAALHVVDARAVEPVALDPHGEVARAGAERDGPCRDATGSRPTARQCRGRPAGSGCRRARRARARARPRSAGLRPRGRRGPSCR